MADGKLEEKEVCTEPPETLLNHRLCSEVWESAKKPKSPESYDEKCVGHIENMPVRTGGYAPLSDRSKGNSSLYERSFDFVTKAAPRRYFSTFKEDLHAKPVRD